MSGRSMTVTTTASATLLGDPEAGLSARPRRYGRLVTSVLSVSVEDDGYDIADYTSVHPSYGTLPDSEPFSVKRTGAGSGLFRARTQPLRTSTLVSAGAAGAAGKSGRAFLRLE